MVFFGKGVRNETQEGAGARLTGGEMHKQKRTRGLQDCFGTFCSYISRVCLAFPPKAKKVRRESLSVKAVGKTDRPTNH